MPSKQSGYTPLVVFLLRRFFAQWHRFGGLRAVVSVSFCWLLLHLQELVAYTAQFANLAFGAIPLQGLLLGIHRLLELFHWWSLIQRLPPGSQLNSLFLEIIRIKTEALSERGFSVDDVQVIINLILIPMFGYFHQAVFSQWTDPYFLPVLAVFAFVFVDLHHISEVQGVLRDWRFLLIIVKPWGVDSFACFLRNRGHVLPELWRVDTALVGCHWWFLDFRIKVAILLFRNLLHSIALDRRH